MAWVMDSCEIEINGSEQPGQSFYQVEDLCVKEINDVVFYGKIKDSSNKGLEGALLKIFAIKNDGEEIPLNHFYSGKDGYYLVSIPRPDFSVSKYIIRTSKSSLPSQNNMSQTRYQKLTARVPMPLEVDNTIEMAGE